MTRRYLNLDADAWRSLCRNWRPPLSAGLLWQRHMVGPLLSRTKRMQAEAPAAKHAREKANLTGALFILGYWRSGTTLLHELLAANGTWSYPTTHACMNPHAFLLGAAGQARVKRPMDDMLIGAESPQEDEFALLNLGTRSPYEALLFPSHLAEALRLADLEGLTVAEQEYWRKSFFDFLTLAGGSQGGKPMLLKSPPHACRIPTLRRLLPDCRFAVIMRAPYATFESTVNMWCEMFKLYALTPIPADDDIRAAVLENRPWFERKLEQGLKTLAAGDVAFIRFEDMIRDPAATIARLYAGLGMDGGAIAASAAAKDMARRSGYRAMTRLPPPDWKRRIDESWGDVFERYEGGGSGLA
jgi:omega-hydroxy-beta-dihydromenaquinone-9 sulfotransferase